MSATVRSVVYAGRDNIISYDFYNLVGTVETALDWSLVYGITLEFKNSGLAAVEYTDLDGGGVIDRSAGSGRLSFALGSLGLPTGGHYYMRLSYRDNAGDTVHTQVLHEEGERVVVVVA